MSTAVRVIPCLDVDAGRVVKGVNFADLRDAGDPVELAHRYDQQGADELTFLDVTATTLWKHSKHADFPSPVARCGMCANSYVYDAEAVRRYEEGTPVDPSDRLVSLQEAADELELSYGSMRTYLGRHADFPKPVKYTGPRPLFSLQQIRSWQDKRQRMRSTVAEAAAGDALEVEGLLTRAGVAAELGVKLDTVTRYQRRDTDFSKDFPESVRKIGRSRLWDRQQVRAWRDSRPSAQRQA